MHAGAFAITNEPRFGESLAEVFVEDVDCIGNESMLLDCPADFSPFDRDMSNASVVCQPLELPTCPPVEVCPIPGKIYFLISI